MTRAACASLTLAASCIIWLAASGPALAVDYRVEKLAEPPPADALAAEQVEKLAQDGLRVIRGSSTTLCDVWLVKAATVVPDFKPTAEVQYPFKPGALLGVVRFARKSGDFRDQDVAADTYTLRYGQQPVDGAHVGTSPTRDFLVLIRAELDSKASPLDYKPMAKASAESAGSNHPLIFSLHRIEDEAAESPSIKHHEDHDWWIVRCNIPAGDQENSKSIPVEVVVVGEFVE